MGGRHPGWGTANRIVPLGDAYLELIAVVDATEAAGSAFGRWVASAGTSKGQPLGWAVRPRDFDATARRLGLTPQGGSRVQPDGESVRWRTAGIESAVAEPALPFFIEWGPGVRFPGSLADCEVAPAAVTSIELDADQGRLSVWLGEHSLRLRVRPGNNRLRRVRLTGSRGEIVLGEAASSA